MKVDKETIEKLARNLAELIADEVYSTHSAALIMHESEIRLLVRIIELVDKTNPIEGKKLDALRRGLHAIWDESKVLSGKMMDTVARGIDLAEQQDKWEQATADSKLIE